MVLPADYRKALGLTGAGHVMLSIEDGEVRLRTASQSLARAQALFRQYVPAGRMLSEELIRDRREEARREDEALRHENA